MLIYQTFLNFRHYREGDENTVQYPIRGRDQALEQIHEQYVRAAEQARQHRTGCWSFPGTGSAIQIRLRLLFDYSSIINLCVIFTIKVREDEGINSILFFFFFITAATEFQISHSSFQVRRKIQCIRIKKH